MKNVFKTSNPPKPGSIVFHILSCAILEYDNSSGHECCYRDIWGSRLAESYKKRTNVTVIIDEVDKINGIEQNPPQIRITLTKRNKKNKLQFAKSYGVYQRWYMWTLTKEMEFCHQNCWYQLQWLLKYFLAWIINIFQKS